MTNATNNTPIPDAELAELRRLHAAAEETGSLHINFAVAQNAIYRAFPGLLARLEAAEKDRDDLEAEVEELRANSIEYEKDSTKALCSLAREFDYDWDGDGATADDLREFISTTLDELQKQAQRLREGGE